MKTLKDLPSPKGKFITGHLSAFGRSNKHQVMEDWVKESGNLFQIRLLTKRFIVSADQQMNSEILKNRPGKFRRFSKISEVMEEMGITGVFNAEGEVWKKHRKITSEALNVKNMPFYFPIVKEVTQRLLNKWIKLQITESKIEVQLEMMKLTVDITSTLAFGYPMNTLEKKDEVIQKQLEKIFPMINSRITAPLPTWRLIKTKKDKELDKALEIIFKTIQEFIQEAKSRLTSNPLLRDKPSNFLEALLIEQEKDGSFSDKEIIGNVFTMLLAGEDTTSNSISWMLYYLSQNPEMVKKIRNEATEIYGNGSLPEHYDQLALLKYTEAVALEAMRLKPVTPTLYHEALEDVTVKDLQIKKGTTVMLQNKVAQTHPDNFTDPDSFFPERWIAKQSACPYHKPEVIHVFGMGPRFCPGKALAMQEMICVVSMICKNFDFELAVDKKDITEEFAFTMYPKNLWIRLKKVDSYLLI
ncbi:MAG TPA: cytochrome P450 [Bacteroidia bacterium]|nr:cytochrome P450 [Bacteroidia bacterium]